MIFNEENLANDLLEAEELMDASDFSAAYNIYRKVITTHNNSAEIFNNIAICCHQIQNINQCLEYIDKAINLEPKNAFYLAQKAKFIGVHNFEQANLLYLKAIDIAIKEKIDCLIKQIKCDYAHLLLLYGCIFAKDQNKDSQESAIFLFKKSIENNPGDYKPYFNLAYCYINTDQIEIGIKYLKHTLELNPNHAQSHFSLSQYYQANDDLENAEKHLKLAIASENIHQANAEYNYGVLEQQKNNFHEALLHYKQCLVINPEHFAACYNSASIFQKIEDYQSAIKCYKEALKIKPDDTSCQYLLSALDDNNKENKFSSTPQQYTENLFDSYADDFENELLINLDYKTPENLYNLFFNYLKQNNLLDIKLNILDLGCGSGLIGQVFNQYPGLITITGVDLSRNMLNQAKKKNLYHDLIKSDINNFLSQNITSNFNLITLADVLVYYGDLEELFMQIKTSSNNSTTKYLLFSVENELTALDYKLNKTGRFSHNVNYVRNILNKNNFCLISEEHCVLRKNKQESVAGILFLASTD